MDNKLFFSLRQAAEYVGRPLGTFRHHVYVQRLITPRLYGRSVAFSRAQLDDYKANGRTDIAISDSEAYTPADAADYLQRTHGLDITEGALRKAIAEGHFQADKCGNILLMAPAWLDEDAPRCNWRGQPTNGEDRRLLFAQQGAAEYVEMAKATFRYDQDGGRITPVRKGLVKLFSRAQLDDYKDGRRTEITLDEADVFDQDEAASFLGLDVDGLLAAVYEDARLWGDETNGRLYFLRSELERFRAT